MADTPLPYLASRLFNTPLAVHPGKARAILEAIGGRFIDAPLNVDGPAAVHHIAFEAASSMGRLGDPLGRRYAEEKRDTFDRLDDIAIIPIEGSLIHKGKWVGAYSGDTSYEGIQTRVRQALADDTIRGVVFEVDSYGGEVAGAFDTAALIRKLSAAKPTIAILTDFALSAGYLLASAAREVVMPESGRAGSIGVITLHADYSGALAKRGVKVSVLSAGKFKGEGNPYKPLPPAVADRIQADLEEARVLFANAVAEGRGDRLSGDGALATDADDFRGADALRLGLVDAVGHSSEAFETFRTQVRSGTSRRPSLVGEPARARAGGRPALDDFAKGEVAARQLMATAAGKTPASAETEPDVSARFPVRQDIAEALNVGAQAAASRAAEDGRLPPRRTHESADEARGASAARHLLGIGDPQSHNSTEDRTVEEVRSALALRAHGGDPRAYTQAGLKVAAFLSSIGLPVADHARLSAAEAERTMKD